MRESSRTSGNGSPRAFAARIAWRASSPLAWATARIFQPASICSRIRRLVELSSTTRTGIPSSSLGSARGPSVRRVTNSPVGRPNRAVKWKELPRPSRLSTPISPPIIPTSRAEMLRPSPVPPKRRVVELSAWEKGWKMTASFSSGMPMPVSVTVKRRRVSAWLCDSAATRTTTSPRCVNLMALPTRLMSTWRTRPGSPSKRLATPDSTS